MSSFSFFTIGMKYSVVQMMYGLKEWIDPDFPGSLTTEELQSLISGLKVNTWTEDNSCPSCGSPRVIRKGHTSSGSQRYCCKDCGGRYISGHNTSFPNSHVSGLVWGAFIRTYLNGETLRVCSRKCNVCLKTSFLMKRRLIESIQRSEGFLGVVFHGEVLIDGCSVMN